jgi:HlyD family secretion protein
VEQLGVEKAAAEDEGGEAPRFEPDSEGFVELVWVVAGESAEARQVSTGIQSDTHIEVLDGLDDGEEVVTGTYRAISRDLSDGATIVIDGDSEGRG